MSKAFASNDSDDSILDAEAPLLPPGTKNYMTLDGVARFRAEFERLTEERARWARSSDVTAASQTARLDRRLRFLANRLDTAQAIDPKAQPTDQVRFGATVTVIANRETERWRIVGIDEADLDKGWISWMSPLASELMEKRVGESFRFRDRTLRIDSITYEA